MSSSPLGDGTQHCDVLLEPVCRRQTLLPECVSVCLTALLQDWDDSSLTGTTSESWVLHSPGTSAPGAEAFQHLLVELCAHCVHVVRRTHNTGPRLKDLFAIMKPQCLCDNCIKMMNLSTS